MLNQSWWHCDMKTQLVLFWTGDSHHKGPRGYLIFPILWAWIICGTDYRVAVTYIFTVYSYLSSWLRGYVIWKPCHSFRRLFQCVFQNTQKVAKGGFERIPSNNTWNSASVKMGDMWSAFWQVQYATCTWAWLLTGANETRIPAADNR